MPREKLNKAEAQNILDDCGIGHNVDFYALNNTQVIRLVEEAKRHSYFAPKNANGSRGRYFCEYLQRKVRS